MIRLSISTLFAALFLISTFVAGQEQATAKARAGQAQSASAPAEDISGMYSFLSEGEFLQINIEQDGVSGYISRKGNLESDRGAFLDQFFSKASVQGHDVSFVTKPLHGVTYEFKGKFERGPAKTRAEDGYYILRGTLKELTTDSDKKTSERSRQVEFKLLAQPPEDTDRPSKEDRPKEKD